MSGIIVLIENSERRIDVSNTNLLDIKETVEILKQLDVKSLLILDSGARMLKARQDMDKDDTRKMRTIL